MWKKHFHVQSDIFLETTCQYAKFVGIKIRKQTNKQIEFFNFSILLIISI